MKSKTILSLLLVFALGIGVGAVGMGTLDKGENKLEGTMPGKTVQSSRSRTINAYEERFGGGINEKRTEILEVVEPSLEGFSNNVRRVSARFEYDLSALSADQEREFAVAVYLTYAAEKKRVQMNVVDGTLKEKNNKITLNYLPFTTEEQYYVKEGNLPELSAELLLKTEDGFLREDGTLFENAFMVPVNID